MNATHQSSREAVTHRLSGAERLLYARDGALMREDVLPHNLTTAMRHALDLLIRLDHPSGGIKLRHEPPSQGTTADNPGRVWMVADLLLAGQPWLELARHPSIVVPLMDFLGPNVELYNAFARIKPPNTRAHLAWHQDFAHDLHNSPQLVTVLVYLDDTGPGAAATEIVVGSHARGSLPHDAKYDLASQDVQGPIRCMNARSGSILFLDTLTIHRAGRNLSDTDRRVLLFVARAAGCREIKRSPHALTGLPLSRDGVCLPPQTPIPD